ncbi:MAG: alanine:cation symporter family protein, partial [Planctomycetota bacterium]|nr:alanine:cation symporter family protein [Planctomycetota bacterium]
MRLKIARTSFLGLVALVLAMGSCVANAEEATKTDAAKTEAKLSDSKSVDAKTADAEKEKATVDDDSFMKSFEKQVDAAAGKAVGALASVIFYEILGHKEFTTDHADVLTTVDDVRPLVDRAKADGINIGEADLELKLPHGSLTKKQVKTLEQELSKQFTEQRALKFSVKIADEGKQTGTSLKAIEHGFPIVVLWLVLGAIFFTLRMNFINFRAFKHAILVTAGKYDNPSDHGEVSHFQALTAALSATVGLGNIAGVAIAVATGGPGATFWMVVA